MIVSVPMPHGTRHVQLASFQTLSVSAALRLSEASGLDAMQQLPVYAAVLRDSLMDPADWAEIEQVSVDDFGQLLLAWAAASKEAAS